MKRRSLLLTLIFVSPLAFSTSPNSNCVYETSECTTYYRKPLTELQLMQLGQMNAQAAYSEYQRALASKTAKLRQINEQVRQSQSKEARVQACLSDALANKNICITRADSSFRSNNGSCHWYSAASATAAIAGIVASVPTFGWGAAVGGG